MARARFLDQVSLGPSNASSPANIIVQQTGSVVGIVDTLNFTGSGVESINLTGSIATIYLSGGSGSAGPQGPSGSVGPQGASGSAGPQGAQGTAGASSALAYWLYNDDNTMNDPGAGFFKLNQPWAFSTTQISIDDLANSPSVNFGSYFDSLTSGSIIKLEAALDSTIYKFLQITSILPYQSGYEVFTVTQLGSNGSPSVSESFAFSFPASSNITDPFPYTGSAGITGSLAVVGPIVITGSSSTSPFLINIPDGNGDEEKFKVNEEGTLVLGKLDTAPTAISGGIFYSASNEFFLGFI